MLFEATKWVVRCWAEEARALEWLRPREGPGDLSRAQGCWPPRGRTPGQKGVFP